MRSSSLALVVMVSLGVSVIITLGCDQSSGVPSPSPTFSVQSISPTQGPSVGATVARIAGTGFRSGDTVTVDGNRVDATVLNANTISLAMPAHTAGRVDVAVINSRTQAQATVPGGYRYVHVGPPIIIELVPNIGSTAGGTPMIIKGAGFQFDPTVSVGGIVTPFDTDFGPDSILYLSTPAHAAGTVEVIVTNPDGQSARAEFTYASPATLDFNGDWQRWAQDLAAPPGSANEFARLVLTIRDNIVVSVSCGSAPSLTLDPPPVVANGEFSFAGSGGVSITGKILSPIFATGSINMASCVTGPWTAQKK